VRRRVASSCWRSMARVAARAGSDATRQRKEEPARSGERRVGELAPGGAGRAARGQLAAWGNAGNERRAAL
jgi:hypothetical protein